MEEWDSYGKYTYGDDPWDTRPARKKARSDPAGGLGDQTALRETGPDAQPVQKGKVWPIVLAVVLILVILAGIITAAIMTTRRISAGFRADPASEEGDYSGRDDFSVDVDPDYDASEEGEEAAGPSEIEAYTGSTSFAVELQSSQDLEPMSYQDIYASVLPSVVSISVYNDTSGAYATGIVLTEDGYILTNQHVVAGETFAMVTTWEDETYAALLVGEDANSDLAVLKIEAAGLTPAVFGDSSELVVGDECFAIGNPMGASYRGSFTNGIISALNRTVTVNDYSMNLVQTTAALNTGNSGGPLINIYGQVVGVCNMKIMSSATTVEGLGFAIPSSTVQRVANALLAEGKVEHPAIGITCYSVTGGETPEDQSFGGLYVVTVDPQSDAGANGLTVGDIITAFNGEPVRQVADFDLTRFRVGDQVTITVYRDGEYLDITFALVEQNDLG